SCSRSCWRSPSPFSGSPGEPRSREMAMSPALKRVTARGGHLGLIGLFTVFSAFPFYWMFITTFKRTSDLMKRSNNPFIYNEPPTLENLRVLFFDTLYVRWLGNTLFVGVLVKVVIPISLAGILPAVIFTLTLVMQEFVYALTFITAARNYTVSVGVPTFLVHGDVYFWGSLMAGCFIASVPVAVLYNFFV